MLSHLMDPVLVNLAAVSGYIFTGPVPGSFAFVPHDCVSSDTAGNLMINDEKYFVSGWSRKNLLFNQVEVSGSTLFGQIPVCDPDMPGLAHFVARLKRLSGRAV